MENLKRLAAQMKCGLYADCGTDMQAAFDGMCAIAASSREPQAVFTAAYLIINTLCNVIEAENEEE